MVASAATHETSIDAGPGTQSPLCARAGNLILPNGNGLVAGGDNVDLNDGFLTNGFFSLRIFNPFGPSYSLGPNMPTGRWYPTLATLADGTVLIMGGAQVSCCPTRGYTLFLSAGLDFQQASPGSNEVLWCVNAQGALTSNLTQQALCQE